MSDRYRTCRGVLGGVAAAAGVFAGCASRLSDDTVVEESVDDSGGAIPPDTTTDFQVRSLRAPVEVPFVSFESEETPQQNHRDRAFVLSDEQAGSIGFDIDHEAQADVRSFLDETDYDAASVVVHQRAIEACYLRHVEYVTAREGRYYVQFCRRLKPATTRCEAEITEMEAIFIRVPYAYEREPSSRGSGERSRCRSEYQRGDTRR